MGAVGYFVFTRGDNDSGLDMNPKGATSGNKRLLPTYSNCRNLPDECSNLASFQSCTWSAANNMKYKDILGSGIGTTAGPRSNVKGDSGCYCTYSRDQRTVRVTAAICQPSKGGAAICDELKRKCKNKKYIFLSSKCYEKGEGALTVRRDASKC